MTSHSAQLLWVRMAFPYCTTSWWWKIDNTGYVFRRTQLKMQLFVQCQQTHTLEVQGSETVQDVKVGFLTLPC